MYKHKKGCLTNLHFPVSAIDTPKIQSVLGAPSLLGFQSPPGFTFSLNLHLPQPILGVVRIASRHVFFSIFGGEASSHKQQIHLRKWSKNSQQDGKMLLDKEAEKPFKQVPTTVVEGGRSHCPYSITTLSGSDSWREFQSKL